MKKNITKTMRIFSTQIVNNFDISISTKKNIYLVDKNGANYLLDLLNKVLVIYFLKSFVLEKFPKIIMKCEA